MKTTKCEIKNTQNKTDSKLNIAKEKISEHEHTEIETIQSEIEIETKVKQKNRIFKNEKSISKLWEYFKKININVNWVPEGVTSRLKKYWRIAGNVPKVRKIINPQIQKPPLTLKKGNMKKWGHLLPPTQYEWVSVSQLSTPNSLLLVSSEPSGELTL